MFGKYSRLLYRFLVVSFRDMSEFRIDFFTSLLHNLIYQGIFILFWKAIVIHTTDALGDWSFSDLVVLSSFTLVASAMMQWFVGLLRLSNKVVRGEVDKYLCKPVSPLFALLAEEMNGLGALQQMASAVFIFTAVCLWFDVTVTLPNLLASLFLLFLGGAAVLLIQAILSMLAFWFGDVSRLNTLFMMTGEFERYPLTLFPGWLRGFLTWIVPIGLISTYPVLVLLGRMELEPAFVAGGLALVVAWAFLFHQVWQRALARYESFGG